MFINLKLDTGEVKSVELDAENVMDIYYSTDCGYCGKEIRFDEDEFYKIVAEHGYYGSIWFCGKDCSEKFKTAQDYKIIKGGAESL